MKTLLRWVLILTQTGGGFLGIVFTLAYLFTIENIPAVTLVISIVFVALYAFVTITGVRLAFDDHHTNLMRLAIWLQVPVLSSPIFAWIFSAGFSLNLTWIGTIVGVNFWLGSRWQFNLLQELPWGIGINLFAVLMLILLKHMKSEVVMKFPDIASQINTILQYRILDTHLAGCGIYLQSLLDGNISIVVGTRHYLSINDVPDEEVKLQVKYAIEEWEKSPCPMEISSRKPYRIG